MSVIPQLKFSPNNNFKLGEYTKGKPVQIFVKPSRSRASPSRINKRAATRNPPPCPRMY